MDPNNFSFSSALLDWYDAHGRKNLPWQQNKTRYSVWISEIMLQQTQVTTVIGFYNRFIQRFPNVSSLAEANQDEVLHLWTGLGYYARARNLHKAAKIIRDEHKGIFPSNFDHVLALPGIGKSTAAAILSLADNQAYVILDGNVKRVLGRFFAVEGWPGNKKVEDYLWELALSLKPYSQHMRNQHGDNTDYQDKPNVYARYTQAIMDFGATFCTRSKPKCEQCPMNSNCLAYAQGRQLELPHKKPKKQKPIKRTFMYIPFLNGNVYMKKRPQQGIWGGLFGFYESENEIDSASIENALFEKIIDSANSQWISKNIEDIKLIELSEFRHTFSHYHLDISPVLIDIKPSESESKTMLQKPKAVVGPLEVNEPEKEGISTAGLWCNIYESLSVGVAAPTLKLFEKIKSTF